MMNNLFFTYHPCAAYSTRHAAKHNSFLSSGKPNHPETHELTSGAVTNPKIHNGLHWFIMEDNLPLLLPPMNRHILKKDHTFFESLRDKEIHLEVDEHHAYLSMPLEKEARLVHPHHEDRGGVGI